MQDNSPYSAPESDVMVEGGQAPKMSLKEIYTSFEGRIPRKVFWIYGFLGMIGFGIVGGIIVGILTAISETLGYIAMIPLYIALVWFGLAIQIKRWHDRDKSGWWVLIGLIPVIGSLWQLIECGFLEGTQGQNQFGPTPADY